MTDPEPDRAEPGLNRDPGPDRDPGLDRRRHTRFSRWVDRIAADPRVARGLAVARRRPREVALGAAGGVLAVVALVAFVSCAGPDGAGTPVRAEPTSVFSAPPPEPSGPLLPSPTSTLATDGCHGLLSAAQVSAAAGFTVGGAGGDAAAAVTGYADAVRAQGFDANVRLCPFGSPSGDQVFVLAMTFADAGQASRVYATGQAGPAGSRPVPGVGDAAATDGVSTLLTRRGRNVVLVFLIRPGQPTADHGGALRSVALAALARA